MKRLLLIPLFWLLQSPVYANWGEPVYQPCAHEAAHDEAGCCGQADAEAKLPTIDPEELTARTVEYGESCPVDEYPDQPTPCCGGCRCRPLGGLFDGWRDLVHGPCGQCGWDYDYSHGYADANYFWQEDDANVLKHQARLHLPCGFEYSHRLTWFSEPVSGSWEHEDLSSFDIESTLRHHFYWDCCPSPFFWALQYDDADIRSPAGRAGVGVGLHHWFPHLYCRGVRFDATLFATTDSSDVQVEFTWHVPLGCGRMYLDGWADYDDGGETWEVSNQFGLRLIGGLHIVGEHYHNEAWSDASQWRGGLQWIAWFK